MVARTRGAREMCVTQRVDLLALGAHPGDVEIAIGGTIHSALRIHFSPYGSYKQARRTEAWIGSSSSALLRSGGCCRHGSSRAWVCPPERCRTHAGRRGRTTVRTATTADRHRDRTDRDGVVLCDSFLKPKPGHISRSCSNAASLGAWIGRACCISTGLRPEADRRVYAASR